VNPKVLDLIILVLVSLFFIGLLAFEYPSLGLENPLLPIPNEFKEFFEFLIWPIGLSAIKQLKTIKMGAKIFHKTKKISQQK